MVRLFYVTLRYLIVNLIRRVGRHDDTRKLDRTGESSPSVGIISHRNSLTGRRTHYFPLLSFQIWWRKNNNKKRSHTTIPVYGDVLLDVVIFFFLRVGVSRPARYSSRPVALSLLWHIRNEFLIPPGHLRVVWRPGILLSISRVQFFGLSCGDDDGETDGPISRPAGPRHENPPNETEHANFNLRRRIHVGKITGFLLSSPRKLSFSTTCFHLKKKTQLLNFWWLYIGYFFSLCAVCL